MKKFITASLLLVAVQCQASLELYGVGNLGFMLRETNEKFINFEKYGGGIGVEYHPLSFFSVGGEFEYTRGSSSDPIPYGMDEKVSRATYGGYREKGLNLVPVHYFEIWFRPKFIVPFPLIEPYIVLPISPMSIGGIEGYPSFGVGLGALLGFQVSLKPLSLFVEAGTVMRTRKGGGRVPKPPWGMFDFTLPVRLGIGYSF